MWAVTCSQQRQPQQHRQQRVRQQQHRWPHQACLQPRVGLVAPLSSSRWSCERHVHVVGVSRRWHTVVPSVGVTPRTSKQWLCTALCAQLQLTADGRRRARSWHAHPGHMQWGRGHMQWGRGAAGCCKQA
jgi:hypothetical protein